MHLFETGNTAPLDPSWFEFEKIHVKSEGYLNMLTDPVTENEINLKVEKNRDVSCTGSKQSYLFLHFR